MTAADRTLTDAEIAAYRRDGFVVPEFRLPPAMLRRLRALAGRLIAENSHIGHEVMACPHVPGSGVQGLRSDPGWMEFPAHGPVLDMVERLIGPDIILWGTTLFCKPAFDGRIIPWHRDGRYWPIKPLATTSIWLAVDDSTVENGCLRCIPGSHAKRALGRHFTSTRDDIANPETLAHGEFDESTARDIELEAGQMAIFDVYTAHGSEANRSGRRRVGFAMRYMPSASHYDHHGVPVPDSPGAAHHTRPLILLRGVDRCGRNDFTIGHPAPRRLDKIDRARAGPRPV